MRDDLKTALRSLRSAPAYTTVAVLVLALGIGAGTAIFSVVDAVVLRALPFDEHDRLVAVGERRASNPNPGLRLSTAAPQNFMDWRARQAVFDGLAAVAGASLTLQEPGGEPEDIPTQRVTSEFFSVLRVSPFLGRSFTPEDEVDGRHRVAILSYGFWQDRFGAAPDIIGTAIPLEGTRYEVVGVAPPGFSYPVAAQSPTRVFVPYVVPEAERIRTPGRFSFYLQAFGRLRDGVSLEQASAQMDQIARALEAAHPDWNKDRRVGVLPLHDFVVGDRTRSWMLLLLGAVALVLLIACMNLAGLMLARASVRERDIGVRAALGAGRWRLVRPLLVESLMLSAAGTALGVTLAWWGVEVLRGSMPVTVPRVAAVALDLRVLLVAAATGALTGITFGLVPALHSARPDLTASLKDGMRGATSGLARQRLRSVLIVAEIALATVLLVGAGLFIGSFAKLMRVDPGFDPDGVLTATVALRTTTARGFGEPAMERGGPALIEIVDRVRHVQGVEHASAISGGLPVGGDVSTTRIGIPGRDLGDAGRIRFARVTADYHRAMRIPLLRGRYLADTDREGVAPVLLINDAAAKQYFPNEDPVGRTIDIEGLRTVVGVVGDVRQGGLESEPTPEVYLPLAQGRTASGRLVIRTTGEPTAMLPAVRAAVFAVLPDVPVRLAQTLSEVMAQRVAQRRISMLLLGLFGLLGVVIAAVGLYGLMAYVVAQRTHEIGVRMALGATRARVISMVLDPMTALREE